MVVRLQWRLPLALACFSPLITLAGVYWVPESPRYLAWVGKKDQAWEVIRKLHEHPSDPEELSARVDFQQICMQVEYDKQQKSTYLEMFRKPSWRHRTLVAMVLLFGTQCSGVLAIGNAQVLIYNALGFDGWMALLFVCIYTGVATISNCTSPWVMDRIGRRRLFRE